MAELEWISRSAQETIRWGRELAARIKPPLLILLAGELGAGKTTLAKGLVAGFGAGHEEDVTSPTFTLIHVFHDHTSVYHVDLYRVSDFHDLETLGLEDVLAEPAIVVVEWAEKFRLRSDWPAIEIHLEHLDETSRRVVVRDPSGILTQPAGKA